jgi:hypothetical protein
MGGGTGVPRHIQQRRSESGRGVVGGGPGEEGPAGLVMAADEKLRDTSGVDQRVQAEKETKPPKQPSPRKPAPAHLRRIENLIPVPAWCTCAMCCRAPEFLPVRECSSRNALWNLQVKLGIALSRISRNHAKSRRWGTKSGFQTPNFSAGHGTNSGAPLAVSA